MSERFPGSGSSQMEGRRLLRELLTRAYKVPGGDLDGDLLEAIDLAERRTSARKLKSLTYTSLARLDLDATDIERIHRTSREANALEGISGLLIFNGTHFLQIIEGAPNAIDDLFVRLRCDERHSGVEVREQRLVDRRSFPDWSMELVQVSASYFEAKDTLTTILPTDVSEDVRERIFQVTERISGAISL